MVASLSTRISFLVRATLGVPPVGKDEVYYRLRRFREKAAGSERVFSFPWGEFEYLSLANLRTQYRNLFLEGCYDFCSDSQKPVIFDCGSNIGMSITRFKLLMPHAEIVGFEADPSIFGILERNIDRLKLKSVRLHQQAVWHKAETLRFSRSFPNAGAVSESGGLQVSGVRLAEMLPAKVDALKLDIEGAEFSVIEDLCTSGAISRISLIMVEFHVMEGKLLEFLGALSALETAGFRVVVARARTIRTGNDCIKGVLPAIEGAGFLAEVYAWRRD